MQTEENKKSTDELIHGYLKGELSDNETRELIDWIKSSPDNKNQFDEYCEIWVTAKASLKNTGYNYNEGFWKFRQKINSDRDLVRNSNAIVLTKAILKYAAIIIVVFSISGLLFYQAGKSELASSEETVSELTVPLGSHAHFSMSDGTTVTLNAGSRLKYNNRFGIEERVVHLEGEGYFKVSKDSEKPFIVETSCLTIRALGTEFNVKAYPVDNKIEATLVEGSIEVEHVSENYKTEAVILKPSQKLTFYKNDSTLVEYPARTEGKTEIKYQPIAQQKVNPIPRLVRENVNVEQFVSWKENRWIFEKESLSQIALELERKFDVKIVFNSDRLKNYRFTGTIIAEPIEQVLEVMSISAPIRYKLEGRVVTISENRNFGDIKRDLYKQ
jgi:ferric-dicitrate binding protein FerR (iron transport regulator)